LVRIHRAGEGAPYTGLKAAGQIEPAVAAADKAIEAGKLQPLARLLTARTEKGLHEHFAAVTANKRYDVADVDAGRAFTHAYVEFVHYAERVHDAAKTATPERAQNPAEAHTH
jgi:hypothetical protein